MSFRRSKYLDKIRVYACFLVILMHTSTLFSAFKNVQDINFSGLAVLNQLSAIAVPLFLMVTGSLILKTPYTSKKQFKLIMRMLILYVVFGVIEYISVGATGIIKHILNPISLRRWIAIGVFCFFFYYYISSKKSLNRVYFVLRVYLVFSLLEYALYVDKDIINAIFNKDSYRWYLIVLAGVYLIQPILCEIANNKRIRNLALIAGFVYIACYNIALISKFRFFNIFINDMAGAFSYRVIFYLLLGYYMVDYLLHRDSFALKRSKFYAFILIVVSSLVQIKFLITASLSLGKFYEGFKDYFSIFVLINSLCIYTLVYNYSFSKDLLSTISSASLYTYLIHLPVLHFVYKYFIVEENGNNIIAILYSALIFIISVIIAVLINKIITIFQKHISGDTKD